MPETSVLPYRFSGCALRSASTCTFVAAGAVLSESTCAISDKRSQNRRGTRDTIAENASTHAATQRSDARAQKRAASAHCVQRRDVRCTHAVAAALRYAQQNSLHTHRRTRVMRKALALLVAGSVRAALDPLLPAASPWTLSTRRRWTLSRATRRLVFEESGDCWFDDCGEEGTWEVRGDAVSFTTECSQNVTRHYHCLLHRNHGLDGNSGRPRLVRGVTARDRASVAGAAFSTGWGLLCRFVDYDRRGEVSRRRRAPTPTGRRGE